MISPTHAIGFDGEWQVTEPPNFERSPMNSFREMSRTEAKSCQNLTEFEADSFQVIIIANPNSGQFAARRFLKEFERPMKIWIHDDKETER